MRRCSRCTWATASSSRKTAYSSLHRLVSWGRNWLDDLGFTGRTLVIICLKRRFALRWPLIYWSVWVRSLEKSRRICDPLDDHLRLLPGWVNKFLIWTNNSTDHLIRNGSYIWCDIECTVLSPHSLAPPCRIRRGRGKWKGLRGHSVVAIGRPPYRSPQGQRGQGDRDGNGRSKIRLE